MNCPNCQQQVANGAAFCGTCGARLASAAPSPAPDPLRPTPALATAGAQGTAGAGSGSAGGAPFSHEATASFVARVKGILLSPKTEWQVISGEDTTPVLLFTGYVIPLAVLAALVNFIRLSVVGISMPFGGTFRTPMVAGLTNAVFTCVMAAVGVGIIALIINLLARTFGGTSDLRRALQTSAYSLTAAYIGTILGLLPMGTLLSLLAGLYGIYTLYLGLPVMMRSRPDKAVGYTASVVICSILLGLILGALSASLGIGMSRAGLGAFHHSSDSEAAQEEAAATVGNAIGSMLGTDDKGKQGLGAAISNLAKAGQQMEQQEKQRAMSSSGSATTASSSSAAASSDSAGSAQPNPAAAVGGLMSALGGSLGGAHRHAPVDFHQLEAVLPASLPGMTRQQASGAANQALGIKKTSATGTYRGSGDARAEVNITDAAGVAGLMDVAASMNVNESSESDSGFEKDVSLGGRKVHEKYDRNAHHGEISAIVARRFTVDISADNVSVEDLERSMAAVDLSALEGMKDAGATSE
jgi:hypothetical protein